MSILDIIVSLVAPHECIGCHAEGALLCIDCCKKIPDTTSCCFLCMQPTKSFQTCITCSQKTLLQTVWRTTSYKGIAKELIWRLKFTGARNVADQIAFCMAGQHSPQPGILIVPIPTATSRVRQRGYDQAGLLAKAYAKQTGTTFLPCLARLGQQHQRGASRSERQHQLTNAYRVTKPFRLQGANIIILDDVATTGATLQAAAAVLMNAGAANIEAIVFAQA